MTLKYFLWPFAVRPAEDPCLLRGFDAPGDLAADAPTMPPKNQTTPDADDRLERELAGLKSEYERLRDDKVRAEQDLSHLEHQLRALEEAAVAAYGTADPEELKRLLERKRAENARLVGEYRQHIEDVKKDLEKVEQDFAGD